MIGNDLVDLRQAARESNWMRKGFLSKLFNAREQQYIILAAKTHEMIWLLWSMKEAAYKIDNKRSGLREFAPLKLACKLTMLGVGSSEGQVTTGDHVYFTRSDIQSDDHVHTLAACSYEALQSITSIVSSPSLADKHQKTSAACRSHHGRYLALIF